MTTPTPIVKYRVFKGVLATGTNDLPAKAAEFAARVGRERLIGISRFADKAEGVVTLWYWDDCANVVPE